MCIIGGRTWLEKVDLSLLGKICLVPCSFLSSFGFLDAIRGAASATCSCHHSALPQAQTMDLDGFSLKPRKW